jgi:deoxyribodipyrimidine photo-lyase
MSTSVSIFWFRRDLRLEDNTGLLHALAAGRPVLPVFIFDSQILDRLEDRRDRRVEFILGALGDLRQQLERRGGALRVEAGNPPDVLERLAAEYSVSAVFTNHDYEPYALRRDATVRQLLEARGIAFHTFKDQVIFEKEEVLKSDGTPYTVFTPYGRRWRQRLEDEGAAGIRPSVAHPEATGI